MSRRSVSIPGELEQDAHTFLHYRQAEAEAKTLKEGARDRLKGWVTLKNQVGKYVNGDEDENGNRILPWTIAGRRIIAQRKIPAPVIGMDAAEKLLRDKGGQALYDIVFKRKVIREFDENELFALNQKGVITDAELDALEIQGEVSYALVVADAPAPEDE